MNSDFYISGEPWIGFLIRLLVNMISTFVLIRFIYYPNNHRVKFIFTFYLMGLMIFLISSILDQIEFEFGFALGLFAIFAIIRFRSPPIDLKELTYLFLVIGISVINALVDFRANTWYGLFITNFIVLSTAFIMEIYKPKSYVIKRLLVFRPSDFSVLNNNELLMEEIRNHTGIEVLKAEINKINPKKKQVSVWVFFDDHNKKFNELPDDQTDLVENNN